MSATDPLKESVHAALVAGRAIMFLNERPIPELINGSMTVIGLVDELCIAIVIMYGDRCKAEVARYRVGISPQLIAEMSSYSEDARAVFLLWRSWENEATDLARALVDVHVLGQLFGSADAAQQNKKRKPRRQPKRSS